MVVSGNSYFNQRYSVLGGEIKNSSIILATTNKGKINEISEILGNKHTLLTFKDFPDWPDVEETGDTFIENALIKAKTLAEKYNIAAIADDSGLEVYYLNKDPGVDSARYAGKEQNDKNNIEKLLVNLKNAENRDARFVTVAVFYYPDGKYITAEGEVKGVITEKPYGDSGFGYDPVFKPNGNKRTMAQMSIDEKNKISHRGIALRKLKDLIVNL